ncbi:hypothetical protein IHE45_05G136800 [Dioscorea alata]|uniref:Uncharacterized protein n=1 Tax=Dioscorea alata TaxID=55571 RepID=A0ACB7W5G3_DIOAL|nr:hypothetical protein IHE45_05G136800 [Dioscorea alata]
MKLHNFAVLVIIGAILSASSLTEATIGDQHFQGTTTAIFSKNAAILRSGESGPPSPKGNDSHGPGH